MIIWAIIIIILHQEFVRDCRKTKNKKMLASSITASGQWTGLVTYYTRSVIGLGSRESKVLRNNPTISVSHRLFNIDCVNHFPAQH